MWESSKCSNYLGRNCRYLIKIRVCSFPTLDLFEHDIRQTILFINIIFLNNSKYCNAAKHSYKHSAIRTMISMATLNGLSASNKYLQIQITRQIPRNIPKFINSSLMRSRLT